jgi:hypothetical protein
MNISSVGTYVSGPPSSTIVNQGSSENSHPIDLTQDSINSALDATSDSTNASNSNFLIYNLNASITNAGDFTGAQTAIDTYTQSLPTSNVYDSSYTAPSAQFLKDLATIRSAAGSGSLEAAQSALAAAKLDAPSGVADGIAEASANGDKGEEVNLFLEGNANITDSLVARGYTLSDAHAESDAIDINGFISNSLGTTRVDATQQAQITDLARSAATAENTTASHKLNASDPMREIIERFLGATSIPAALNTLTWLNKAYETNGAATTASDRQ